MRTHGTIFAALVSAALLLTGGPAAGSSDNAGKPRLVDFWRPGDSGQRMNIRGRVTSIDGTPLAGIPISIRQANGDLPRHLQSPPIPHRRAPRKDRANIGSLCSGLVERMLAAFADGRQHVLQVGNLPGL